MPEFALTNKINHAHERIDQLMAMLQNQPASAPVTREEFMELAAEFSKLRGEIQALKMRMGKKSS